MTLFLPYRRPLLGGPFCRNELWRRAKAMPSLDLRFAESRSLIDAVTGRQLVTISRASDGTYVDSDRLIKTAEANEPRFTHDPLALLVENLGKNRFANAAAQTGVTLAPGTAIGPDGNVMQKAVIPSGTASFRSIGIGTGNTESFTLTSGETIDVAMSGWFAAGTAGMTIEPRFITNFGTSPSSNLIYAELQINTSNWTVRSKSISTGITEVEAPLIIEHSPGVYRVTWVVRYTQGATIRNITSTFVQLRDTAGSGTFTGDGIGHFQYYGIQAETASAPSSYIPTTTAAVTRAPLMAPSLGLLVEEQRTNQTLWSQQISNVAWTKLNVTVASDSISAPSGLLEAETITDSVDSSPATHFVGTSPVSFESGSTYTFSIYAKAGTLAGTAIVFPSSAFASTLTARFNILAGTIESLDVGLTASITAVGNDWHRLSVTAAATITAISSLQVRTATASATFYQGNGSGSVSLWGAQLEEGSEATSYIPTTTTAVTRAADVLSITGANFSSWYRQDEGTLYAEGNSLDLSEGKFPTFAAISDGTSNNRLGYGYTTSTLGGFTVRSAGSLVSELYPPVTANPRRAVFAAAADNFAVAFNGAAPSIDASGAMPVGVNQMQIGNTLTGGASNNFNGPIRRLVYWPQRLPNSTLQALSA